MRSRLARPFFGRYRRDTGDLRYRYFGVPIWYERMPEPQRTRLMKLAAAPPAIPSDWLKCMDYRHRGTNNGDIEARSGYWLAARYAEVDPGIARLLLEEHATTVPHVSHFYSLLVRYVPAYGEWREDEEIRAFCAARGYAIAPVKHK